MHPVVWLVLGVTTGPKYRPMGSLTVDNVVARGFPDRDPTACSPVWRLAVVVRRVVSCGRLEQSNTGTNGHREMRRH